MPGVMACSMGGEANKLPASILARAPDIDFTLKILIVNRMNKAYLHTQKVAEPRILHYRVYNHTTPQLLITLHRQNDERRMR